MTRYLLDTNHVSAMLRSPSGLVEKLRAATDSEFHLCIPSVGELYFMVFNSTRVSENRKSLELLMRPFRIAPFDSNSAIEFGRIQAELRKLGKPIPAVDVQIAAIARAHAFVLLTADAHFGVVESLQHANWLI